MFKFSKSFRLILQQVHGVNELTIRTFKTSKRPLFFLRNLSTKKDTLYNTITIPNCIKIPESLKLHAIWLRDHCQCSKCYHPITRQRLLETCKIPENLLAKEIKANVNEIEIEWQDGHISVYSKDWLLKHAYTSIKNTSPLTFPIRPIFWNESINKNPPTISYPEVINSDHSLYTWLSLILTYGFAFVKDVPQTIEASQAISERISFIRETHYGKYWDFTSDLAHHDTAYTSLELPLHTDTTYFTDPIRLQLFHLLEFHGQGGESLLLDGFHVANQLLQGHPEAYHALSSIPIASHCSGDANVHIHPLTRYPILQVTSENQELYQIRYNNNDRMILNHLNFNDIERFYRSLRRWEEKLTSPFIYKFPLTPGTLLIFDNWRVLHGRTAFTGKRRLTGCYVNGDDFCSRFRTLHQKFAPKDQ